jgi:ABC-type iron transport system FetAB permease component
LSIVGFPISYIFAHAEIATDITTLIIITITSSTGDDRDFKNHGFPFFIFTPVFSFFFSALPRALSLSHCFAFISFFFSHFFLH